MDRWTCGPGRSGWGVLKAGRRGGTRERGFGPEQADLHSIRPKPGFSARERGSGPDLLHLAQSQVFGSRKGVCLRGRTYSPGKLRCGAPEGYTRALGGRDGGLKGQVDQNARERVLSQKESLVFASTGPNPGLRLEKGGLGQKS